MYSFLKLSFFFLFFSLSFLQCKSSQSIPFINKTVAADSNVYYQNWVAGVKGGGSGTNLFIAKSLIAPIKPNSVYFRGKIVTFEVLKVGGDYYIARFKGSANQQSDYQMNLDSHKEYGNDIPKELVQDFPFDLTKQEAVISYYQDDKLMYLKITNIQEKPSVPYPSFPRK